MTNSSLIDKSLIESLLAGLRDKRLALVGWDNGLSTVVGQRVAEQLLSHFGLSYRLYSHRDYAADRLLSSRCDAIVVAPGARLGREMGGFEVLRSCGLPMILWPPAEMPESFDSSCFSRVYVSNRRHLDRLSRGELVPEPALGLNVDYPCIAPRFERGVFLGTSNSAEVSTWLNLGDPSRICDSIECCAALCGEFEQIVTDSCPMAVIALRCGREVVLVPDAEGSTEALRDSLSGVPGWTWADNLDGIAYDKRAVERSLIGSLMGPRSTTLPMHAHPRGAGGWLLEESKGGYLLKDGTGRSIGQVNAVSGLIWSLCTGELSIEQMTMDLAETYERSALETGRDLQVVLQQYLLMGAIELDLDEPSARARDIDDVQVAVPNVIRTGSGRYPMRVTIREPYVSHGKVHCHATLSHPGDDDWDLWFRLDQRHADALTSRVDPFLLVAVHHAMDRKASTLWIEGAPVTRSLLASVDEFQRAWACWRQDLTVVPLAAEEETEVTVEERPALMCFSGGIDSCYSIYRHLLHEEPLRGPRVTAALMVHGFDVPLLDGDGFRTVEARSRRILQHMPLELVTMETNIRNINLNWDRSHALGCAAALTLMGGRFGTGLIPGTFPYNLLRSGGSNPTTDWLLGSRYFGIRNDQAASSRLQKVLALVHWPHALRYARFCWKDDRYGNCGTCSKCIITAMMLRCAGINSLECFETPVSDEWIARHLPSLSMLSALERFDVQEILRFAEASRQRFPWVPVLEESVRRVTGNGRATGPAV